MTKSSDTPSGFSLRHLILLIGSPVLLLGFAYAAEPGEQEIEALPGKVLWLRGDAYTPFVWPDESGEAHDPVQFHEGVPAATEVAGFNGHRAVVFSGAEYFALPDIFGTSKTGQIFTVLKADSSDTTLDGLWRFGMGPSFYSAINGVMENFGFNVPYALPFSLLPDFSLTTPHLYEVQVSYADGWALLFNSDEYLRYAFGDGEDQYLGFDPAPLLGHNGENPFAGKIAEVIAFDRVLTPAQRDLVNRYLVSKYALPPAHSPDSDGDGLSDAEEASRGTNPLNFDTDGDGMPDGWEVDHGLNPLSAADALADPDGDGLTNVQEFLLGRDPVTSTFDPAVSVSGTWLREFWGNIPGARLAALETATSGYSKTPSFKGLFFGNERSPDIGDNYGERLRAWISVPTEGDYVFAISGDNDVRFSLSSDAYFGNIRTVATFTGFTTRRQWTKFPTQKTAVVHLVPGVRYYAELMHKEEAAGDHFALGYRLASETDADIRLVPHTWVASYTADPSDADGDGLPDAWEAAYGLLSTGPGAASGVNGTLGDPDGDGLTNFDEYRLGLNPKVSDVVAPGGAPVSGALIRDLWKNIAPADVAALGVATANYTTAPTSRTLLSGAESTLDGITCGERLYGFITPTTTGDYRFAVASDDTSEVWLSTDGTKEHAVKIASVNYLWTPLHRYDLQPSQVSAPVHLIAGHAYFIDIRHVNIGGAGHLSLAWRTADSQPWLPVPASVLTVGEPGNDINGNGLPDAWEIAQGWTVTPGVIPPGHGANDDPDGDGLTNAQELAAGTNPNVADNPGLDTDGDGIPDVDEIHLTDTDPLNPFTAGDPAYDDSYGARGYAAIERWAGFTDLPALDEFRESDGVNHPGDSGLTRTRTLVKTVLLKGTSTAGGVVERVRGWITPQTSGVHTLTVTMEDGSAVGTGEALLRLSTDDTPFLATNFVRFAPTGEDNSRSATVTLEAGKSYYYELWLRKPDATTDARLDCTKVAE